MKSYLIFVAMVLTFMLVLAGCDGRSPTGEPQGMFGTTNHLTTKNGLECVFIKEGYGGGLSCNWEKYNKEQLLKNMQGRY